MSFTVGMYVRFPFDYEFRDEPREFLIGQIFSINELKSTAILKTRDPFGYRKFYDYIQAEYEISLDALERCASGTNVHVRCKSKEYVVLGCDTTNEIYRYYIQSVSTKAICEVSENDLEIPFNCMDISPFVQISNYEFQNPVWYIGRSIVSRSLNTLNNSISGFPELAGCKIELLPHQLITIMRCVQSDPCRFMLADEVGMGKTIEAIGVVKIYCNAHTNKKIVILVPSALKEQWKTELLFKFDLSVKNQNNNFIFVLTLDEIMKMKTVMCDFLVVDEAHHYLSAENDYTVIKNLSEQCENVLLLSATPVQEKGEEYLNLLRLLNPKQYNSVSMEEFQELVSKQKKIVKQVHYAYGSLSDLIEQRDYLVERDLNPAEDQDMQDLFDELIDQLDLLKSIINDEKYDALLRNISFDSKNYSIPKIKALLVYISERYQIDENVIRNRRRLLRDRIAEREYNTVIHSLEGSHCIYEKLVYTQLCDFLSCTDKNDISIEEIVVPLLEAFFSSAAAFSKQLEKVKKIHAVDNQLLSDTASWVKSEKALRKNFITYMDEDQHSSRVCEILSYLNDVVGREKVVLFTDFEETLSLYKDCLDQYFGEEAVVVYSRKMNSDTRETNVYKFQYDDTCQFLLCDSTGGEGKNFQNAKYVVHLDIPWDAVALEQRIGRLDRLGRNPDSAVVSIILYDEDTVEETLFKVFNDGLHVFSQSLSGLEIVVGELNRIIIKSVADDIKYGLEESLTEVVKISSLMNEEIKAEQIYDVAGFEFKPLNRKISKSIQTLYSQNSTILQMAMIGWSSLTGFNETSNRGGICSFSSSSFSYGSAIKTLLIPPTWDMYKKDERLIHIERIRSLTAGQEVNHNNFNQRIRGTFDRELAIKTDYLHFFAPGDPIFDCIINNAMTSCKGRCSAMQITCGYNWQGFIMKFVNKPNLNLLYKNGISREQCNQFVGYIDTSECLFSYSVYNPDKCNPVDVLKEFRKQMVPQHMYIDDIVHLGRRSKKGRIVQAKQLDISNMEWFRETFKESTWKKLLEKAYASSCEAARGLYDKNSRLGLARDEIDTILAVKRNKAECSEVEYEKEKRKYDLIIEALENSVIELDSIAFVWMTKNGLD